MNRFAHVSGDERRAALRVRRLMRLALALLVALAAVTAAQPWAAAQDIDTTVSRLAVFDASSNTVLILDTASGTVLARFSMPGPTSLYASSTGRWFYGVHSAQNRLTVIDTGLRLVDHGDHLDLTVGPPYVRGTITPGRTPIDFWAQNGMATVHNDDDGTLAVLDDRRLEVALDYVEIHGAGTGHNNAVVLGDIVLLSLASAGRITAYGMDNSVLATFEGCPGTHGWTTRGDMAIAGCTDGVMVITKTGSSLEARKIAEPAGGPDTARVSTLRSNPNSPVLIGNFGDGLAIIRPDTEVFAVTPLPTTPLAFAFDRGGERVVVLTTDGTVHALEPTTGRLLFSVAAAAQYVPALMGQPAPPRPGLAVGDGIAYVTDPTTGEVVEVDLTGGTVARRLLVGGTPTSIAMVSLRGAAHD